MVKATHCTNHPAKSTTPETTRTTLFHERQLAQFPWLVFLISISLFASSVLAFTPALFAGYINLDDNTHVYDNPLVTSGLSLGNAVRAFDVRTDSGYWAPLTWLSLMLDSTMLGVRPFAYHSTNVLLHALNTVLLFLALSFATYEIWRSAIASAIWALHPLRVESVVWISERKDVLSGFWGLIALAAYCHYARSNRWLPYVIACFCLMLSLMAKAMMITLPLVFLLLDIWPLERLKGLKFSQAQAKVISLANEKIPFFAICLFAALATIVAQQSGDAVRSLTNFPIEQRLYNGVISYVRYLFSGFVPTGLAVYYPHFGDWSFSTAAMCLFLLLALSAGALRTKTQRPWLIFGWLWFLLTFLPMIGLIQVGGQSMADRFTYFPFMGLSIAVAWTIMNGRFAPFQIALSSTLVLVLASLTFYQASKWHDSVTLWTNALNVTEDNEFLRDNLGKVLLFEKNSPREAIPHFVRALELENQASGNDEINLRAQSETMINLGVCYSMCNETFMAIQILQKAISVNPESKRAYLTLGAIFAKSNKLSEAELLFRRAIEVDPDDWHPYFNIGLIFTERRQYRIALAFYEAALSRHIDDNQLEKDVIRTLEKWRLALSSRSSSSHE